MFSLGIRQLNQKLASKQINAEELTQSFLNRIAEKDNRIGSFISFHTKSLENAKNLDMKGDFSHILSGIPYANKPIICIEGQECNAASKILEGYVPVESASLIKKLDSKEAVCLGNVNCDEFAQGSSTENSGIQTTKNPWNESLVPGGSSGGSAAAVAADLCTFALGTDTGGSIRQPATFCGVVGLKPTYGRVSRSGVMAYASSFDTIGPITKSVEDAAIVLEAIAGHDPKDFTTPQVPVPTYSQNLNAPLQGRKVAYIKEFFDSPSLDAGIKTSILDLFDKLQAEGVQIQEISMKEINYSIATYYILVKAEGSTNLHRYDGIRYGHKTSEEIKEISDIYDLSRSEGFGSEVKRCIMLGTYTLSAGYYDAYYVKAAKVRRLIKEAFDRVFASFDAIIAPVSPFLPFAIGEKSGDPLAMYLADIYTVPVNLAGIPALSLPIGRINNLPVGIQIMGKQFNEEGILQIGKSIEDLVGFQRLQYE